jgi:hypothetical protein
VHRGDTSLYARYETLIALKYKHNCNGHGEDTIKTKGCKLEMDVLQFFISGCNRIANNEMYSSLNPLLLLIFKLRFSVMCNRNIILICLLITQNTRTMTCLGVPCNTQRHLNFVECLTPMFRSLE